MSLNTTATNKGKNKKIKMVGNVGDISTSSYRKSNSTLEQPISISDIRLPLNNLNYFD